MAVIYADELFFENAVIDYILLLATAKITGRSALRWRMLISSVLGGIYSVLSILPGCGFLQSVFVKLSAAALMVFVVYGYDGRFLRTYLVFLAVSASFAGAVIAFMMLGGRTPGTSPLISVSLKVLTVSFAACYGIFSLFFSRLTKQRVEGGVTKLRISLGKRTAEIAALRDSGNVLTDPVSGDPVIICDLEAVAPILDKRTAEILRQRETDPASALRDLENSMCSVRFRLIPYSALGVRSGMLAAFRPDGIEIDGKSEKNGLVAIAPSGAFAGNGYSALTGAG